MSTVACSTAPLVLGICIRWATRAANSAPRERGVAAGRAAPRDGYGEGPTPARVSFGCTTVAGCGGFLGSSGGARRWMTVAGWGGLEPARPRQSLPLVTTHLPSIQAPQIRVVVRRHGTRVTGGPCPVIISAARPWLSATIAARFRCSRAPHERRFFGHPGDHGVDCAFAALANDSAEVPCLHSRFRIRYHHRIEPRQPRARRHVLVQRSAPYRSSRDRPIPRRLRSGGRRIWRKCHLQPVHPTRRPSRRDARRCSDRRGEGTPRPRPQASRCG
jgi:hypothetical protein